MSPVLVIAAHPDDEVLGAGGTMARLVREGHAVHVLILGEGATSRQPDRASADVADVARLADQARRAAAQLGVADVHTCGLPDNRFDTLPLLDVVKQIESHIARLQPATIFTQHGGDLNIDHVVTFRATLTASRPLPGSSVRAVYAYEVNSSTEWAFQQFAPAFRPSVYFDVTDTLEMKLKALAEYDSERRAFPHPRSPEAITAHARRCGSVVGTAAAEAFATIYVRY